MKETIRFAFFKSVPVLFGYLFLGLAFGLLLQSAGYNFVWAFFMSLVIYAGAMQFIMVSFLGGGVNLLTIAVMTLLVNSRHAFYGLSFLDKFKKMGKAYPYMIFSLTDETYSLLCSLKTPDDIDHKRASLLIAMMDHSYWVMGSTLGAALGQLLNFNSTGIEFAMTALFVTIFIEQWLEYKTHIPAILGLLAALLCLILLGPEQFMLPTLVLTVTLLAFLKPTLQKGNEG